jgi:hypothetical protein
LYKKSEARSQKPEAGILTGLTDYQDFILWILVNPVNPVYFPSRIRGREKIFRSLKPFCPGPHSLDVNQLADKSRKEPRHYD